MRSFIACHIPDRRLRAQIRFDQFVDKRYGYEIKSYLHFLLLEHPPRGLPWHLNLTFPAVQILIPLHQYDGSQMPYYSARFACRITHQRGSAKTVD